MKKTGFALLVFAFLGFFSGSAQAAYQEYYQVSKKQNSFEVLSRGLGNLAGFPIEAGSTWVREKQMHSRAWPITYPFRLITNASYRMFSIANDVAVLPLATPFIEDTAPLTDGLGLPTYPWNVE